MSTWLFDLGNSRLKCAPLAADGSVGDVVRIGHDGVAFEAGWQARLPARTEVAEIASVASEALRVALLDALAARAQRLSLACTLRRFGDVGIAYAQPRKLGVDRFLAMLGARRRTRAPVLVVGVGTALTLDLLDADGRHRGGRIAPSPATMRVALHARAAQLPAHGGRYVEFAEDTEDALASGCEGAALALVERSVGAADALLGTAPHLYIHGGGGDGLLASLPDAIATPNLVLEGLARWAREA